ncbi:MAG: CPBP family glutamic-type intramembrane protease [Elusimicrobiota bacterium]|jgi:hypothetical protein
MKRAHDLPRSVLAALVASSLFFSSAPELFAQTVAVLAPRGAVAALAAPVVPLSVLVPGRVELPRTLSLVTGTLPKLEPSAGLALVAAAPATLIPKAAAAALYKGKAPAAEAVAVVETPAAKAAVLPSAASPLALAQKELDSDPQGERAPGTLSRLFELGKTRRSAADDESSVVAAAATPSPSALAAPVSDASSQTPVPTPAEGRAPSLSRAVKLGLVLAGVQLLLEYALPFVASWLGIALPAARVRASSGFAAVALPASAYVTYFLKGALVAPLIEELIFRAGLMEFLTGIFAKLGLGKAAPWLSGALTSVAFVAQHAGVVHPAWIAVYLAGALLYAFSYQHEGLASSLAMHGFHNLFYQAQVLMTGLYGPAAAATTAAVLAAAYALGSLKSLKDLRREWGRAVSDRGLHLPSWLSPLSPDPEEKA